MKHIKCILGFHEWKWFQYYNGNAGMPMFVCNRCGKESVYI